jgi:nucleoside-diphosphate-sugar epimerase
MEKLGIVGLGWFGIDLAQYLKPKFEIVGTKRTSESVTSLDLKGIDAFPLDLSNPIDTQTLAKVFNVDRFVLNVPPGIRDEGNARKYVEMMSRCLKALNTFQVEQLIFVSSTGVFGATQEVVDEKTLPIPDSESGKALFEAEEMFKEKFKGSTTILRPAGLVGKGRHPVKYLAGRKNLGGRFHPVNLVHLNDLISVTEFILESEEHLPVVHAVIDHHPQKAEYYSKAAEMLSLPQPEFDEKDISLGRQVNSIFHTHPGFPEYEFRNLYDII